MAQSFTKTSDLSLNVESRANKVDYKEYIYFPDKIDAKRQEAIARGIAEWVKTGKYNETTSQWHI